MNGRMVLQTVRATVLGIDRALLIGFFCGIVCVLVDIDHFIAYAFGIEYPRFLHPYYFALSIGIIIGCCAYIGGLLVNALLRRKHA